MRVRVYDFEAILKLHGLKGNLLPKQTSGNSSKLFPYSSRQHTDQLAMTA